MASDRRSLLAVVSIIIIGFVLSLSRPAAAQDDHRWWALDLVSNVSYRQNQYSNTGQVTWAGVDGANQYANHSNCSGFLTRVLQRAYGWNSIDFANWFGDPTPNAQRFHDAIVEGDGFAEIPTLDEVVEGDIIAIDYPDDSSVSGHVAIVHSLPTLRVPTSPLVAGTWQFEVTVIDSSSSGHGPTDTRLQSDGTFDPGAGIGVMRIYTNEELEIVGYTWSTYSASVYRDASSYHMVIGRVL
jgi:hypothetical protein